MATMCTSEELEPAETPESRDPSDGDRDLTRRGSEERGARRGVEVLFKADTLPGVSHMPDVSLPPVVKSQWSKEDRL